MIGALEQTNCLVNRLITDARVWWAMWSRQHDPSSRPAPIRMITCNKDSQPIASQPVWAGAPRHDLRVGVAAYAEWLRTHPYQ